MTTDKKYLLEQRGTQQDIVDEIIRVDHAGEFGATYIYAGQLAVLGKRSDKYELVKHMHQDEVEHLHKFNQILADRQVRPSALMPLWAVGGFAMGAVSALLGEKAAMACTVAVEDVIAEHYKDQEEQLATMEGEEELRATIKQFREEEIEHRDIGMEHEARQMPGYEPFYALISGITKTAVKLAKKV